MALSFMNPQPLHAPGPHDRIYRALDRYRALSRPAALPVSIKGGVSHIRRTVAGGAYSDNMLVDMIAAHAIQNGYTLKPDAGPNRPRLPGKP